MDEGNDRLQSDKTFRKVLIIFVCIWPILMFLAGVLTDMRDCNYPHSSIFLAPDRFVSEILDKDDVLFGVPGEHKDLVFTLLGNAVAFHNVSHSLDFIGPGGCCLDAKASCNGHFLFYNLWIHFILIVVIFVTRRKVKPDDAVKELDELQLNKSMYKLNNAMFIMFAIGVIFLIGFLYRWLICHGDSHLSATLAGNVWINEKQFECFGSYTLPIWGYNLYAGVPLIIIPFVTLFSNKRAGFKQIWLIFQKHAKKIKKGLIVLTIIAIGILIGWSIIAFWNYSVHKKAAELYNTEISKRDQVEQTTEFTTSYYETTTEDIIESTIEYVPDDDIEDIVYSGVVPEEFSARDRGKYVWTAYMVVYDPDDPPSQYYTKYCECVKDWAEKSCGIIDMQHNVIVEPKYDSTQIAYQEGRDIYFIVGDIKDGENVYAVFNESGEQMTPFEYKSRSEAYEQYIKSTETWKNP